MFEDLRGFFNSEQWRTIYIQRLLREQEELERHLSPEQQHEAAMAVVQLYKTAREMLEKNPQLTVSEAMDLISFKKGY